VCAESAEYNQSQVDGGEETSLWVKFLVLVWTVIGKLVTLCLVTIVNQ
jgi:hypothetical protein